MKENALKKSLDQDEIHKLDLSFYDGLRQPQIFEFYNLKWNLLDNIAIFKSQILKIHILKIIMDSLYFIFVSIIHYLILMD